jgi:transposase
VIAFIPNHTLNQQRRIVKRADGYYVQFCLSVDIREYAKPLEPTKKCVGLDVGFKVFYANIWGNSRDTAILSQGGKKIKPFDARGGDSL